MTAPVLSLGEIESLALRAARGAGLPWGLAEEAGFAARWLQARGADGTAAMARHLIWLDRTGWPAAGPGGVLPSALLQGVALSDAGLTGPVVIAALRDPVLILPFLGDLARASRRPIALHVADKAHAVTDGSDLRGDLEALSEVREASIAIDPFAAMPRATPVPPPSTRPEALRCLDDLAHRTLVPASAASRARAGETAPS